MQADAHKNTEPKCHKYSTSRESPWLHFKALRLTVANDEHSDEEQRDSDPDSHIKKRPLPVFYAEIKDENSCPTAANVRLSTHTYIHKRVHRQTHLSCKCRIITGLSEGGKLGCLLKIAMLKRFIDVTLGNGGETVGDTEMVSLSFAKYSAFLWTMVCVYLLRSCAGVQQRSHRSPEAVITSTQGSRFRCPRRIKALFTLPVQIHFLDLDSGKSGP